MKEMDLLGKCEALFTAWFTGGLARGGMGQREGRETMLHGSIMRQSTQALFYKWYLGKMKEMDLLGKCEALFTAWFTGGLARGGMGQREGRDTILHGSIMRQCTQALFYKW